MVEQKSRFALFFGNRGFFPASLIAGAREEVAAALQGMGHDVLMLDAGATRYGAVETVQEGEVYARFLDENRGRFDGVILVLPNFGDENGAVAALEDARVPILVQAYPDEMDKMSPAWRRDSFCGKISIMDIFNQHNIKFTALAPHTVSPSGPRFQKNVDEFDRICRVVKGLRKMRVGAIGARTTPFKTVRIDEVALQRHGITVETVDLSDVFGRMKAIKADSPAYKEKVRELQGYTDWEGVPDEAFDQLARMGLTFDALVDEMQLDGVAVRCWIEMQKQLRVSPCVLMGHLNNRGKVAACEVDLGNAVAMRALMLASDGPAALLDWNNNYEDKDDKCILFHCGPVPTSLMTDPGRVTDHGIVANDLGPGFGWGCNVGRIKPGPFSFGSLMTDSGRIKMYVGQGDITGDPIPQDFFGCAGVAQIDGLQDVLLHIGRHGHRHHVSIVPGWVQAPVAHALGHYLGYDVAEPQANGC